MTPVVSERISPLPVSISTMRPPPTATSLTSSAAAAGSTSTVVVSHSGTVVVVGPARTTGRVVAGTVDGTEAGASVSNADASVVLGDGCASPAGASPERPSAHPTNRATTAMTAPATTNLRRSVRCVRSNSPAQLRVEVWRRP